MNAVMLADGLTRGGRESAQAAGGFLARGEPRRQSAGVATHAVDRLFWFTPIEGSPVRPVRCACRGFCRPTTLTRSTSIRCATARALSRLRRGARVRDSSSLSPPPMCGPESCACFRSDEITADAVMASACLPFLFRAVEIDGVPYWDGGYMGNPAIFPFFRATRPRRADRPDQSARARRDADTARATS